MKENAVMLYDRVDGWHPLAQQSHSAMRSTRWPLVNMFTRGKWWTVARLERCNLHVAMAFVIHKAAIVVL